MNINQQIINQIHQSLETLELPSVDFTLEHPADEMHGDYASNVAMVLFPQLKKQKNVQYKNPRELADSVAQQIRNSKFEIRNYIDKVEVAGPGFINFTLSKDYLFNQLDSVLQQNEEYGKSQIGNGKRAIVEYSSPNIAKPFTIGHLRSTIIGDAIANLLEANGWEVLRDNHLGDWGTQFGKQIYALMHLGEGSLEKNIAKIEAAENPVKVLVDLYVEFHTKAENDPMLEEEGRKWFKKLEDGDAQARYLWKRCVNWSWKEFNLIYKKLNTARFDQEFNNGRGLGESFFEDKMDVVVKELEKSNFLQEGKEGAKLFFFPNQKYPPAMILKKDGATLYATRDLATDKFRKDQYNPDLIINEVGAEQILYFQQLYEMERILGWYQPGQRVHVGHGLYRFSDKKMSTRKGNVIWLEEVIEEASKRAFVLMAKKHEIEYGDDYIHAERKENPEHSLKFSEISNKSEIIGIGALKYNDLKRGPIHDITFDWEEMLNMQGNSGPYLQYTYARCKSVLRKAEAAGLSRDPIAALQDDTINSEELSILRWLYRYPEVVIQAGQEYAPHYVCTYLYELAQRYNSFYHKHSILGKGIGESSQPSAISHQPFRLALTAATAQVLSNGLKLLGIKTPESM